MRISAALLVVWICVQCVSVGSTHESPPPASTSIAGAESASEIVAPTQQSPDPGAATGPPTSIEKLRVTFNSHRLTLVGFLFKPEGAGPFPAIVWNHGSEKSPGTGPQFDTVARIFVPAGYVVFAPMRRGHGNSQGAYIRDVLDSARRANGFDAANREMVQLMESEQLDDQLAGLEYLKSLPYVDLSRVAVAGCSFGGIETLLAAERGAGYKGAIAISPGAESWERNPELQRRLVRSVRSINVPVLILQPAKDVSLEPVRVLGEEFKRLGKPFAGKVYPAAGPEDEQLHCFGGAKEMHVWAPDALEFMARVLR